MDKKERVTVKEAAKELQLSILTVEYMLREKIEPVCRAGFAIKQPGNKRHAYYIYRKQLDEVKEALGIKA